MAVLKCKICGGSIIVDEVTRIATCEYCGTKQTMPLFSEDSERLLYESGNNYLLHSEYDKAENVFNQLLTINPNAAELYWDLVLCKYGVTYVKDPKNGKYVPTCNRTHYTPIFSDENYKKAIELSTGEKKALFEEDAKTIDNIQKGIIAVSKKEKPFDIFISYKETDSKGNRSKDSVEAQKLYEKLTEAGYKVFFSRITLEDKVGTEYEPYIYAALYSSKVMITVCSSKENIEAVWVKNEWSRFLSLRQKDNAKTLIPIYFNMEKSELPDEFAMIPSFNIKETGFEAELLRGIKKQIPLPIMLAQKRKARNKTLVVALSVFLSVAIICGAIFIPGVIKDKMHGEQYAEAMQLFEDKNYAEAKAIFETIVDYKDAQYMIVRCERQPEYDAAMKLSYEGNYAEATWAFEKLGDYEDSATQKEKAELSWRKSLANVFIWLRESEYYISETGNIETLDDSGSAHVGINTKTNGKVVSFTHADWRGKLLVALHENGKVSSTQTDETYLNINNWSNIVKIEPILDHAVLGLRADGTIEVFAEEGTKGLDEISKWTNIVDFQVETYDYEISNVIGLSSDGTLWFQQITVPEPTYPHTPEISFYNILTKFKNVKSFFVRDLTNIVALTKDGKLLIYSNGQFKETDGNDVAEIVTVDLVLKTNGDLVKISDKKVLLQDVVYARQYSKSTEELLGNASPYGGFCVTRLGCVGRILDYSNFGDLWESEEYIDIGVFEDKTIVHNEWVSRLD